MFFLIVLWKSSWKCRVCQVLAREAMAAVEKQLEAAQRFLRGVRSLPSYEDIQTKQLKGLLHCLDKVKDLSTAQAGIFLDALDPELWSEEAREKLRLRVAEKISHGEEEGGVRRPMQDFTQIINFLTGDLAAAILGGQASPDRLLRISRRFVRCGLLLTTLQNWCGPWYSLDAFATTPHENASKKRTALRTRDPKLIMLCISPRKCKGGNDTLIATRGWTKTSSLQTICWPQNIEIGRLHQERSAALDWHGTIQSWTKGKMDGPSARCSTWRPRDSPQSWVGMPKSALFATGLEVGCVEFARGTYLRISQTTSVEVHGCVASAQCLFCCWCDHSIGIVHQTIAFLSGKEKMANWPWCRYTCWKAKSLLAWFEKTHPESGSLDNFRTAQSRRSHFTRSARETCWDMRGSTIAKDTIIFTHPSKKKLRNY